MKRKDFLRNIFMGVGALFIPIATEAKEQKDREKMFIIADGFAYETVVGLPTYTRKNNVWAWLPMTIYKANMMPAKDHYDKLLFINDKYGYTLHNVRINYFSSKIHYGYATLVYGY